MPPNLHNRELRFDPIDREKFRTGQQEFCGPGRRSDARLREHCR